MLLNARALLQSDGKPRRILLGIRDITVLLHTPAGTDERDGMRAMAEKVRPLVIDMT